MNDLPDHSLVLGVSLAMSADNEDLDRLVVTGQQSGGETAAPPIGAHRRQPSVIASDPAIAAWLPEPRSFSEAGENTESLPDASWGSVSDRAQSYEQVRVGFPAANDPLIGSPPLAEQHRGATASGAAQGGSGKLPSPPIERRRSDRRHVARRRDDGQPGYWRRDDRRSVERRAHARPDSAIVDAEAPGPAALAYGSRDPEAINLFIASRRRDLVAALAFGLAIEPGMQLVGACHTEIGDIHAFPAHASPDLVLLDTALLGRRGADCLAGLRAAAADAKLLLLWDEAYPLAVEEIEKHGIWGCIPLLAPARHYVRAIREVSRGGLWLPRWIMNRVCHRILSREDSPVAAADAPSVVLPALTAREQAIATRAAAGKTNKEIAIELKVSPDTVKKHLGAIFGKIGVHRRSQLAYRLAASRHGSPE